MILHNFNLGIFIVIMILQDSKKLYNTLMPNIEISMKNITLLLKYLIYLFNNIRDINIQTILKIIILSTIQRKSIAFLYGSYNKA